MTKQVQYQERSDAYPALATPMSTPQGWEVVQAPSRSLVRTNRLRYLPAGDANPLAAPLTTPYGWEIAQEAPRSTATTNRRNSLHSKPSIVAFRALPQPPLSGSGFESLAPSIVARPNRGYQNYFGHQDSWPLAVPPVATNGFILNANTPVPTPTSGCCASTADTVAAPAKISMKLNGTAGPGSGGPTVTADLNKDHTGIYYIGVAGDLDGKTFAAGTWTVRINVSSITGSPKIYSMSICQADSTGGSLYSYTIGSSQPGVVPATGINTYTVSGSQSNTFNTNDVVIISVQIDTSSSGSFTVERDQTINAPGFINASSGPGYDVTMSFPEKSRKLPTQPGLYVPTTLGALLQPLYKGSGFEVISPYRIAKRQFHAEGLNQLPFVFISPTTAWGGYGILNPDRAFPGKQTASERLGYFIFSPSPTPNGYWPLSPERGERRSTAWHGFAAEILFAQAPTSPLINFGFPTVSPERSSSRRALQTVLNPTTVLRALPQPPLTKSGYDCHAPYTACKLPTQAGLYVVPRNQPPIPPPPVYQFWFETANLPKGLRGREAKAFFDPNYFRALPQPPLPGAGFEGISQVRMSKVPTQLGWGYYHFVLLALPQPPLVPWPYANFPDKPLYSPSWNKVFARSVPTNDTSNLGYYFVQGFTGKRIRFDRGPQDHLVNQIGTRNVGSGTPLWTIDTFQQFVCDGSALHFVGGEPITAPAHSNSAGYPGQWAWDGTYYYRCVALNTWIRTTPTNTSW